MQNITSTRFLTVSLVKSFQKSFSFSRNWPYFHNFVGFRTVFYNTSTLEESKRTLSFTPNKTFLWFCDVSSEKKTFALSAFVKNAYRVVFSCNNLLLPYLEQLSSFPVESSLAPYPARQHRKSRNPTLHEEKQTFRTWMERETSDVVSWLTPCTH